MIEKEYDTGDELDGDHATPRASDSSGSAHKSSGARYTAHTPGRFTGCIGVQSVANLQTPGRFPTKSFNSEIFGKFLTGNLQCFIFATRSNRF